MFERERTIYNLLDASYNRSKEFKAMAELTQEILESADCVRHAKVKRGEEDNEVEITLSLTNQDEPKVRFNAGGLGWNYSRYRNYGLIGLLFKYNKDEIKLVNNRGLNVLGQCIDSLRKIVAINLGIDFSDIAEDRIEKSLHALLDAMMDNNEEIPKFEQNLIGELINNVPSNETFELYDVNFISKSPKNNYTLEMNLITTADINSYLSFEADFNDDKKVLVRFYFNEKKATTNQKDLKTFIKNFWDVTPFSSPKKIANEDRFNFVSKENDSYDNMLCISEDVREFKKEGGTRLITLGDNPNKTITLLSINPCQESDEFEIVVSLNEATILDVDMFGYTKLGRLISNFDLYTDRETFIKQD